jgi:hypothetical protein
MAYDARAVKISKSVKRLAATFLDKAQRRAFIKSYVRIEEANGRQSSKGREK